MKQSETLYSKVKKIGEPVIEQYMADLTRHDKRDLSSARKGDLFIWAPRKHGTFLIKVKSASDNPLEAEDRKRKALQDLEIYKSEFPNLTWHVIEPTAPKIGKVKEEKLKNIKRLFH